MKKGYSVENPNVFKKTKFIYLFNHKILNEVSYLAFRRNFKERYINMNECVGVWKIKKLN